MTTQIKLLYLYTQISKVPHKEALKLIQDLTGYSKIHIQRTIKENFHVRLTKCRCGVVFTQLKEGREKSCNECKKPENKRAYLTKYCREYREKNREKLRAYNKEYQNKYYYDFKHLLQYEY